MATGGGAECLVWAFRIEKSLDEGDAIASRKNDHLSLANRFLRGRERTADNKVAEGAPADIRRVLNDRLGLGR
jgi:hypothetical protein